MGNYDAENRSAEKVFTKTIISVYEDTSEITQIIGYQCMPRPHWPTAIITEKSKIYIFSKIAAAATSKIPPKKYVSENVISMPNKNWKVVLQNFFDK